METLFTLFGQPVTGFGVGAADALTITLIVTGLYAAWKKLDYGTIIRFCALSVPLTLLMARLFYVLANSTYYLTTLSNPALALRFWDGGYAVSGALCGLIIAAALTERWRHVSGGVLRDGVGLGALCGLLLERLHEAGTGMGLGRAILTPWMADSAFFAVTDETGEIVHAVYRYEALAAALLLVGMLLWVWRRKGDTGHGGDLLLIMLTLLGASQVLLESLRNDGHMVVHFVRINQVLAMLLPMISLAVWTVRRKHQGGKRLWIRWLIVLCALAVGVVEEFRIDSSENLWLDYGVMAVCLLTIAVTTLTCRKKTSRTL